MEILTSRFQDFQSPNEENQVSLVRTFLFEPDSESKISRLGGWGWQNNPETCAQSGKAPWVDSACADCSGFLVPGA